MTRQIITTPAGERLVVVPEAEFDALLDAADEHSDIMAIQAWRRRLAAGQEARIPADVVKRIVSGEHPVRVWREQRSMSRDALAELSGLSRAAIEDIENGIATADDESRRTIAEALAVSVDDIE